MGPKTSPLEACDEYVTLLNLRNWEKPGERYVTEQIYVHSKVLIVDDRVARRQRHHQHPKHADRQ